MTERLYTVFLFLLSCSYFVSFMSGLNNAQIQKALLEQEEARKVLREAIERAQEADRQVYRALIGVDSEPPYRVVGPQRKTQINKKKTQREVEDFSGDLIGTEEDWEKEATSKSFELGKGFFREVSPRPIKKQTGRSFLLGGDLRYRRDQVTRQKLLLPAPLSDYNL